MHPVADERKELGELHGRRTALTRELAILLEHACQVILHHREAGLAHPRLDAVACVQFQQGGAGRIQVA